MSFTRKILPALALVVALAPLAAQAQTVRVDPIAPSSATQATSCNGQHLWKYHIGP